MGTTKGVFVYFGGEGRVLMFKGKVKEKKREDAPLPCMEAHF